MPFHEGFDSRDYTTARSGNPRRNLICAFRLDSRWHDEGMSQSSSAYEKLRERTREIALIGSAGGVLNWDRETYMPTKAIAWRSEQLAYLSGKTHSLFVGQEVGEWLSECGGLEKDSIEAANVRMWQRDYDRAVKLPQDLVEEMARTSSLASQEWMEARREKKFSRFEPWLVKLVALKKREADCLGYQDSPYDALLDAYEPGMTASRVGSILEKLKEQMIPLLPLAIEKSKRQNATLEGHFPIASQQAFNRKVAEAIGFDFESGRIDTTTHPFCSGVGPGDCRLTTRYNEENFLESLYGVLHEAGHGLYEQGLAIERFGTPAGEAVSLGIHESQSRLWENHIGRSVEFWQRWFPVACEHFPDLKKTTPEAIAAFALRVKPSHIRVEADEMTYDLHIILRFSIERELIEGKLAVADVPHRWNEEFKKLMGLNVSDDAMGCLQDVHWSMGGIGYFPTYSLGNLNASHLHHHAEQQVPGLKDAINRGDYAPLLKWLREKIHIHGRRYLPQDLIRLATGEESNPAYHSEYLKKKYCS